MTGEDLEVVLIAAVAADGTIGDEGEMPWYHSEDLAHFKETTMGEPVILGRRTYEAIVKRLGTALPGRSTIVLSRQSRADLVDESAIPDDGRVIVANDIEAAIEAASSESAVAYVAGGRTVYEQFLPLADRLIITEVPGRYDGDTRFPTVEWEHWSEVSREVGDEVVFVEYRRTRSSSR